MDLGSLFLILALLLLVSLFVSRPFFEHKPAQATAPFSQEEHELSSLMAERDRLLTALQELDFDYALGKIPAEDYPAQRAGLLQRGADTLRAIDRLTAQSGGSAEDRIEAIIAARRADGQRSVNATAPGHARVVAGALAAEADDPLEVQLSNRKRQRQEKSVGFCTQCGGAVQKSDRFCPKCGSLLQ